MNEQTGDERIKRKLLSRRLPIQPRGQVTSSAFTFFVRRITMSSKKKSGNASPTARHVEQALRAQANPEKAKILAKFFQTHAGGYGEGDQFLGLVVPAQRRVAKQFRGLPREQLSRLLHSPWHECRLTALFILTEHFVAAEDQRTWCDFYLENLDGVNNWDLVDCSAAQILGAMALTDKRYVHQIHQLSRSGQLWRERVSMIATFAFIRASNFGLTLLLAEHFLKHSHDLMHKATGWMLREVGKREQAVLLGFLDQHAAIMPRTMLRYAIEKFPAPLRKHYMVLKENTIGQDHWSEGIVTAE